MTESEPSVYYYADGERVSLVLDHAVTAAELAGVLPAAWKHALPGKLPVYRSRGARLVALPEVRIEDSDPAALCRVRDWLAAEPQAGEVLSSRPGRLTLKVGEGLACDSVTMAREAVERCRVASASPRFLRLTPRPRPGRG